MPKKPKEKLPNRIAGGIGGITAAINAEFPGANVHQAYVSDWLRGQRHPCPEAPPMPARFANGDGDRRKIMAWFAQYVKPEDKRIKLENDKARKERAEADFWEVKAEVSKKENDERFMLVSEHDNILRDFAATVWAKFCRLVEVDLINGLLDRARVETPEKAESLTEDARFRHKAGIDDLQREFARLADE